MAKIVGIHGIAQQYRGSYQLADVWFSAIRDGLLAAGHPQAAQALAAHDVRVAYPYRNRCGISAAIGCRPQL